MNAVTQFDRISKPGDGHHLSIQYEKESGLAWYYMHPKPRPCCTLGLISEVRRGFNECINSSGSGDVRYVVLASKVPGVFNQGGDMDVFIQFIHDRDRESLLQYANACSDILYLNYTGLGADVTTISLVQGDAFGGGLEYALSSEVFIAERSAKMGLPEILFNLFAGVGAYSLLSRKVGAKLAEEIVMGGRLYSAEEFHEMGLVDILVEDGHGEQAVYDYIHKEEKSRNAVRAFRAAKRCTNPLTREELAATAEIWADAALRLREKDLRMMERLVKRQSAKVK